MRSVHSFSDYSQDSFTKPRILFALAASAGLAYVGYVKIDNYLRRRNLLALIAKKRRDRDDGIAALERQLKANLDDNARVKRKEIVQLSFEELRSKLQDGELTAVETLEAFQLAALEAHRKTNFACQFVLEAKQWAEELDAKYGNGGEPKPPLFGIPFSNKECNFLAGYDATAGLAQFIGQPAKKDSEIVSLLKQAGAIPFVLTNVPTTMWSVGCSNSIFGTTTNPYNSQRTSGGSSGGEGPVLALRGSPLGIGGDIGGSVRTPAHLCGISALKPSVGRIVMGEGVRVPMSGITGVPATAGPMALEVDSLVWFMRVMCSPDSQVSKFDPYVVPIPFNEEVYNGEESLTIGYYDHDNWISAAPACRRAVIEAKEILESRGHRLVAVPFPFDVQEMRWLMECYVAGVFPDGGTQMAALLAKDIIDPAHKQLAKFVSTPIWLRKLKAYFTKSPYFQTLYRGCESSSAGVRFKYSEIFKFKSQFAKFWNQYKLDAIICPVASTPALPTSVPPRFCCIYWSYCALYNLLNYSAGTVRCTRVTMADEQAALNVQEWKRGGLDDQDWVPNLFRECQRDSTGLPVGVQVVTLPFTEELCLRVMKEIENGLKEV